MIEKYYTRIARTSAIIFSFLGLIVIIDYVLPREIYSSVIGDKYVDSHYNSRRMGELKSIYFLVIDQQPLRTDVETFRILHTGEEVEVQKTKLLGKISSLKGAPLSGKTINIYVAPFSYFPLFPVLFLLPIFFAFTTRETLFLMVARPISLLPAFISLLMMIF